MINALDKNINALAARHGWHISPRTGDGLHWYEVAPMDRPDRDAILHTLARGKGLGRALLLLAMDLLAGHGHDRCWLQVSTANEAAYRLYQETGFYTRKVRSQWFRAELEEQKDRDMEEDGK